MLPYSNLPIYSLCWSKPYILWECGILFLYPHGPAMFSIKYMFFHSLNKHFLLSNGSSDGKASAYNVGDLGSIPGLGRSPGGHGTPNRGGPRLDQDPFHQDSPPPTISQAPATHQGQCECYSLEDRRREVPFTRANLQRSCQTAEVTNMNWGGPAYSLWICYSSACLNSLCQTWLRLSLTFFRYQFKCYFSEGFSLTTFSKIGSLLFHLCFSFFYGTNHWLSTKELMLLNSSAGEDSSESPGLQDQTTQSQRK